MQKIATMKRKLSLLFLTLFFGKTLLAQGGLKDAECDITLCCEEQPFEYNLEQCVKAANPSLMDSISPSTFFIQQSCGTSKTYIIPYTVISTGAKGKVIVKAQILKKGIIALQPQLICEDDSVKIASSWLKCADAKPGIQNITVPYSPKPGKCDTIYNFLLQCIKLTPIVTPQNPILGCLNPKITLNAGQSLFLPISTATNKGVKSYLWSASKGGIITGDNTASSITVAEPGTYTVTISYTYTLNAANGSATKTCSKIVETQVIGIGEPLSLPQITDLTKSHSLQNPSLFKVNSSSSSMLTHEWLVKGGSPAIFKGDSIAITWDKSAVHQVCVKNILGECSSPFSCLDITLNTTKSNDFLDKEPIIVFSNPISEHFSVFINASAEETSIQILSITGELKVEKSINMGKNTLDIDALNWVVGIYILQLKNKQNEIIATRKLIKL